MPKTAAPRYRWVLVLGFFLPMIVLGSMEYMAPSVTPLPETMMRGLGISDAQMGMIIGIVGLMLALFCFFSGLLVDRAGPRRTITASMTLMGVGGFLSAISPDFYTLLLSRLVFGLGYALHMPALSPIIMTWFPRDEYGKAQTVPSVSSNIGMTMVFMIVPMLALWGWRNILLLFSTLILIVDAVWLFGGRDPLRKRGSLKLPSRAKLKKIAMKRNVLLCALAMLAVPGFIIGFFAWYTVYSEDPLVVSMFSLGSIVGMALGGYLMDRVGLRRPFMIWSGCVGTVVMVVLVQVVEWGYAGVWAITIPVALIGSILFQLMGPAPYVIPMETEGIDPEDVHWAMALVLLITFSASFISPVLIGALKDITGTYYHGLMIASLTPILILIAGAFMKETGRKAAK